MESEPKLTKPLAVVWSELVRSAERTETVEQKWWVVERLADNQEWVECARLPSVERAQKATETWMNGLTTRVVEVVNRRTIIEQHCVGTPSDGIQRPVPADGSSSVTTSTGTGSLR